MAATPTEELPLIFFWNRPCIAGQHDDTAGGDQPMIVNGTPGPLVGTEMEQFLSRVRQEVRAELQQVAQQRQQQQPQDHGGHTQDLATQGA